MRAAEMRLRYNARMMRLLRSLLCVITMAPLLVIAASNGARVDSVTQAAGSMQIVGTWPNSCMPQVEAQNSDGSSLDVLLADSGNICTARERPFRITVDQQESFSPAPPAGAVRTLHVFAAPGSDPQPALVGFRLLGGDQRAMRPDDGFWWPTDAAVGGGSVLSIEVQDEAMGVALMSYDDASGDPVWYFGTTEINGSVAHVDLTRMQYGASPFGAARAQPQPQQAFAIDLQFLSATRVKAWISRPRDGMAGMELVTMDFARVPFSNLPQAQDWLGPWLLASTTSNEMGSTLPRMLVWTQSTVLDAHRVRLQDDSGTYALECRHIGISEDSPAQQCVLLDHNRTVLARFDQVALHRLDGVRADGNPVILVRAH